MRGGRAVSPARRGMTDRRLVLFVGILFAAAALAAVIAVYAWRGNGAIASIGGPFALVDQDGRERTDRDFHGRYALIYFGYAFCPDVCPTALSDMMVALDELGPRQDRIQPVFVTIDPERDTPERLKSFVAEFDPRLIGLSGSPAQITAAAKAYRVYYAKAEDPEAGPDYLMNHSSVIYLIDPRGRYVTHFNHGTAPDRIAERLLEELS